MHNSNENVWIKCSWFKNPHVSNCLYLCSFNVLFHLNLFIFSWSSNHTNLHPSWWFYIHMHSFIAFIHCCAFIQLHFSALEWIQNVIYHEVDNIWVPPHKIFVKGVRLGGKAMTGSGVSIKVITAVPAQALPTHSCTLHFIWRSKVPITKYTFRGKPPKLDTKTNI